jgi:hypothetical protein
VLSQVSFTRHTSEATRSDEERNILSCLHFARLSLDHVGGQVFRHGIDQRCGRNAPRGRVLRWSKTRLQWS